MQTLENKFDYEQDALKVNAERSCGTSDGCGTPVKNFPGHHRLNNGIYLTI